LFNPVANKPPNFALFLPGTHRHWVQQMATTPQKCKKVNRKIK
jgi:hypothetical protein